ncbi:pyridoxamine 5'-phosphate oxidase family protein [Pseudonocardia sp. CA-107938]|uniref:pyridoxamine 5'-phosphate oxidase family protein n=1 Tax=Pseudonocardia sp. CA-107938 TaxID=3240021 RepID=UPI003D89D531
MTATTAGTGQITTIEELEALIGRPAPPSADKVRTSLDAIDVEWIAATPLIMLATSDADGRCDVSPKGDPAGFVRVLDPHTIAMPERPGNRRVDGYRNIVVNPHAGLIFLIPGRDDTLRINGRARIVTDGPYFDDMVVKGHRPRLALELQVEEVFYHCAKAFLRSRTWKPETWDTGRVPSRARISHALERKDQPLAEVEAHYGPAYAEKIYQES